MSYKVPILIITFNRPNYTKKVLAEIFKCNPSELYVFQDAARKNNDNDLYTCIQVREIVDSYKSDKCNIHKYYAKENLGCGAGPKTAIDWFFSHVEKGLIFEDDCVPHQDFFTYAEELLERYRDDDRISFIGGCNYWAKKSNESYFFTSGHHLTWGWATWKRTWQHFDYTLSGFDKKSFGEVLKYYYKTLRQQEYWLNIFDLVKKDQMQGSCWDYQLYFSCWKRKMIAIAPSKNLVTNVGSGEDATHTKSESNALLNNKCEPIMPLLHPKHIVLDSQYDSILMKHFIIPYEYGLSGIRRLPYRILKRVRHFFNS